MSGREWKPGDVAMVPGCGPRVFTEKGWVTPAGKFVGDFCNPRPLVVIDPESIEDRKRLAHAYLCTDEDASLDERFGTALRSLIAPPKPDEPLGLGAVVEDADGNEWVRHERVALGDMHWRPVGGSTVAKWRAIDAVRVLSEGVS